MTRRGELTDVAWERIAPLLPENNGRRGIPHTIPERRAGYPGRPPSFAPVAYRRRNVVERCVERCVNRLKQWRGIATRYEKRASNYRAIVVIAALLIWLTL